MYIITFHCSTLYIYIYNSGRAKHRGDAKRPESSGSNERSFGARAQARGTPSSDPSAEAPTRRRGHRLALADHCNTGLARGKPEEAEEMPRTATAG